MMVVSIEESFVVDLIRKQRVVARDQDSKGVAGDDYYGATHFRKDFENSFGIIQYIQIHNSSVQGSGTIENS